MKGMDLAEALLGQIGRYYESVKPLIDERKYLGAHSEMSDLVAYLDIREREIRVACIPSSWNMCTGARQLCRALSEDREPQSHELTGFEAYAAQVSLHLRAVG
jgi:hypothetical protein